MFKQNLMAIFGVFALTAAVAALPGCDDGPSEGVSLAQSEVEVEDGVFIVEMDGRTVRYDSDAGSIAVLDEAGELLGPIVWTSDAGDLSPRSACGSEASTLIAAINLVQSACAKGGSATCSSAQSALDSAFDDYTGCIIDYIQVY
jgi:hypothetical protein